MNHNGLHNDELSMDEVFLKKLQTIIEANLGNPDFGITELGIEVGMSRSQIHRKLQKLVGKSPSRYIRSQRLIKAKEYLERRIGNVSEIADRTGFRSLSYFTQVFIEEFGCPPSEVKDHEIRALSDSESPQLSHKIRERASVLFSNPVNVLQIVVGLIIVGLMIVYFPFTDRAEGTPFNNSRTRLAILPFRNDGNIPEHQYFVEGINDVIINNLSNFQNLEIIPENTIIRYQHSGKSVREILEELNADYLMETSVVKNDENISIEVQLINSSRKSYTWSKTYHARWPDIQAMERQLTLTLADQIELKIHPEEIKMIQASHNTDPRAHIYFLKSSEYMKYPILSESRLEMARALCMDAIKIDSTYAEAWMGIGVIESTIYARGINRSEAQKEKIRNAFDQAIFVADFDYTSAKFARAFYVYSVERDYTSALHLFTDLAEAYPWHRSFCIHVANCYRRLGEFEKAAAYYKELGSKFPGWPALLYTYGQTCKLLHRYEEAENAFKQALALEPLFFDAYIELSEAYVDMDGNQIRARKIIEQNFLKEDPNYWYYEARLALRERHFNEAIMLWESAPEIWTTQGEIIPKSLGIALTRFQAEKYSDSLFNKSIPIIENLLEESPNDFRLYISLGLCYAGLGEKEKAIDAGLKATRFMNLSMDALSGKPSELGLARIYIMTGEYDQALTIIERLLTHYITSADLKLDPMFDPLRNHPEFQNLISSSG